MYFSVNTSSLLFQIFEPAVQVVLDVAWRRYGKMQNCHNGSLVQPGFGALYIIFAFFNPNSETG